MLSASQKVLKFWTIRVLTQEFNNSESIKINLQIRLNSSTEQTLMPTTSESSTKSGLEANMLRRLRLFATTLFAPANEGGGSLGCDSGHLVERAGSPCLSKRALSRCKPRKLCWFPAESTRGRLTSSKSWVERETKCFPFAGQVQHKLVHH